MTLARVLWPIAGGPHCLYHRPSPAWGSPIVIVLSTRALSSIPRLPNKLLLFSRFAEQMSLVPSGVQSAPSAIN